MSFHRYIFCFISFIHIYSCYPFGNDVITIKEIQISPFEQQKVTSQSSLSNQFLKKRNAIIQHELKMALGGSIQLNPEEYIVNNTFYEYKKPFYSEKSFYPREMFLSSKTEIHSSKSFKFIQKIPKGASLHIHEFSMYSDDWIIQNVTYRPNLFYCPNSKPVLFRFSNSKPMMDSNCMKWQSLAEDRKLSRNVSDFDSKLRKNFVLTENDLKSNQNEIWSRFLNIFNSVQLLLANNVFDDYIYHGLSRFYQDNVQYMEIRFGLLQLYDLDGRQFSVEYTIERFIATAKRFVHDHPDFLMPKLILYSVRFEDKTLVASDISRVQQLMLKYPNTVIGYDLVGPENSMHSLLYYINDLLKASHTDIPIDMRFFFHAGETDWMGTNVDANLYDAILLNATRLGHAYALLRHPVLYEMVKKRQIPLEVNPISNQILGLVRDMRNHPATILFADDAPLVISSDDPAMWGAEPLSDDFFMALIALGGEKADLATAKQLALNSIKFSVLSDEERSHLTQIWQTKWTSFIHSSVHYRDYTDDFEL